VRKKVLAQSRFDGGKSVLRQAMAGLLPEEVMRRPKQGFSAPDESWYRGENAAYVRDLLMGDELACADYLNPDEIHRVIEEHMERKVNHRLLIWSFMCFEWWCRIFLQGQRPV